MERLLSLPDIAKNLWEHLCCYLKRTWWSTLQDKPPNATIARSPTPRSWLPGHNVIHIFRGNSLEEGWCISRTAEYCSCPAAMLPYLSMQHCSVMCVGFIELIACARNIIRLRGERSVSTKPISYGGKIIMIFSLSTVHCPKLLALEGAQRVEESPPKTARGSTYLIWSKLSNKAASISVRQQTRGKGDESYTLPEKAHLLCIDFFFYLHKRKGVKLVCFRFVSMKDYWPSIYTGRNVIVELCIWIFERVK